ncbi:hypothetical protein SRHO_G00195340 [Serrasalmus rhombeus]
MDCPIRWGLKQKRVECILAQTTTIRQVFAKDRRSPNTLTWQDQALLEGLDAALKPVVDFREILSSEDYVTVL